MALCIHCGKKAGMFSKTCVDCDARIEDEGFAEHGENIRASRPDLFDLLQKFDIPPQSVHWDVIESIPTETQFKAMFSGSVFLTERGIVVFKVSLTSGAVSGMNTIPIHTISSFDVKPRVTEGDPWVVRIKRPRSTDEFTSYLPDLAVRDFVEKVQLETSGGSESKKPQIQAPSASVSERIIELTQLFEQGLISQEQLEKKKEKLLDEI